MFQFLIPLFSSLATSAVAGTAITGAVLKTAVIGAAKKALISTAVSKLGSTIAGSPTQAAPYTSLAPEISESSSEIDLVAMRNAAEKAGFNPLTALRAGIGQGFTKNSAKNYPLIVPPLQAAGPNYGSMLVDNFMQFYESPYDREMKNLQMESLKLGNKYTAASIGSLASSGSAGEFYKQWNISKRKDKDGNIMYGEDGFALFTDLKLANEAQPQYLPVYDPITGVTFSYMNPDLYDIGATEAVAGTGMLSAAQALGYSLQKNPNLPGLPVKKEPLRIILDDPGNLRASQ